MTSQLMKLYRETNIPKKKITDVKLASKLKKDSKFCFSILPQEHCHRKSPGAWLWEYVNFTVLF